jgi:hypothetical protein
MNRVECIRAFFGNVSLEEFKTLTAEDRKELGELCAKALGVELKG